MRNLLPIFLISCLCIFIGCLGVGGSGSGISVTDPNQPAPVLAAGRVYFADRQLYGGIPVSAKNQAGAILETVLTDTAGNFAFTQLPVGIYDFIAQTGDSEVIFARSVAIDGINNKVINTTPLLGVKNVIIDEISSTSFHVKFHSNRACRASIEYGPLGGYQQIKTIGQAGQTVHEATLTGLKTFTDYEITLFLTGDDGQDFVLHGLTAATTGAAGPTALAVAINEGAYETRSNITTLYLKSSNSTHMRISENFDMSDAPWVSFSSTYAYSFKNTSPGTKRIFVQFRDANGVTSPVQSDSILFSLNGYLGIWLDNGVSTTNKTDVLLTIMFPGATEMQLSDNPGFLFSYKEPYTTSKRWKLSGTDGQKTVYCRFFGGLANYSEVFTASILLDTTAPDVEIKINNGKTVTATTSVVLTFSFSIPPAQMKLANTTAPTAVSAWQQFSDTVNWVLPTGDGAKSVYGIFKDSAGNEFGPIAASIDLDTVPPTGNSIEIKKGEDSASEVATFALTAELPIFLHFTAADETTEMAFYGIGQNSRPAQFFQAGKPFQPVQISESLLKGSGTTAVGTYTVWAYFTDLAGNAGFDQKINIKIDGPKMAVTPSLVTLKSGENQLFVASTTNINPSDVGNIKWRILSPGTGTVDAVTGLYTAPAPVLYASRTTLVAYSEKIPTLLAETYIDLATSVELLFQQPNGIFTYDTPVEQVAPSSTTNVLVKILHGQRGIELIRQPGAGNGSVAISQPVADEFGMLVTLTYTAPAVSPAINPVIIGIRSLDRQTLTASLSFTVAVGANIKLSQTAGEVQRGIPLTVSATISSSDSENATWELNSGNLSFSNDEILATIATNIVTGHTVTVYATGTVSQKETAKLTITVDDTAKDCALTVWPPLKFEITPSIATALPIIEPITFSVLGIDNLSGNATEAVTWSFKNALGTEFKDADGRTYSDRGSLTIIDATKAEYRRPSKRPSESDAVLADYIQIKATAVSDPLSFNIATVSISEKVSVEIFDAIDAPASITSKATVAEVGKIQFFAKVKPADILNKTVNWTINGTTGSDQTGTIDDNGLYVAPDQVINDQVTVRATSNYDPSVFAEVKVSLSDFWIPVRTNMFDANTSETMQILSLLVDPYSMVGENFTVYAGTQGYGVWTATFSDKPGEISGGNWDPVRDLGSDKKISSGSFRINHLVILPNKNVYAATASGIWYIPSPDSGNPAVAIQNEAGEYPPESNFLKLAFDSKNPKSMYATTPKGVYRVELKENDPSTFEIFGKILNTTDPIRLKEVRVSSGTETIEAYSDGDSPNPLNVILNTIVFDDYNDRLYAGGEDGVFLYMNNMTDSNLTYQIARAFKYPRPATETEDIPFYTLSDNQPRRANPDMENPSLDLALDVINRNTLWAATVGGIYRSVNNGMTWAASAFTEGSGVNTRAIIVDPTNTINVMAGSEDGLYRTTDAGGTWKRIRSGLGNHKTITCLIQAAGAPGARRKVWVGTAGGVFMGRQSLDLE